MTSGVRRIFSLCSFALITGLLCFTLAGCSCNIKKQSYAYHGSINLSEHRHITGKKIFIDPGHGARGNSDGRKGPTGLREEEVNLKVGQILEAMCLAAGADVKITRETDVDISLEERVKMAEEYKPDIFISIHHNGSARPADAGLNFASILIWGNRDDNPASYDLGERLRIEFEKVIKHDCNLVSDYSVFRETGAKVLRETKELCPGILGEFGFFSDRTHEAMLKDESYNTKEAECYFNALSDFFKQGVPDASFVTDQRVYNPTGQLSVRTRSPQFWVRLKPDTAKGIEPGSLKVTLNGRRLQTTPAGNNLFKINYGSAVYGGGSRFRMSYRNANGRSSMVLTAAFAVGFNKGEFDGNINEGSRLAETDPARALEMLLPMLTSGFTDPKADTITYYIARAFDKLGDKPMAAYHYTTLYQYFPDSPFLKKISSDYFKTRFVPTDYYGKVASWEKM